MRKTLIYSNFSLTGLKNAILRWDQQSLTWGRSSIPWNTSFFSTQEIGYYYLQSAEKKIIGENINSSTINSVISKLFDRTWDSQDDQNFVLGSVGQTKEILAPICSDGAFCSWWFPLWARGAVLETPPCSSPSHPARVSGSQMLPWTVVVSAWTFSIAPSSVCSTVWCSAKMKTPLPHFHTPAAPPCTELTAFTAVKWKGTVMHRQENHTKYSSLTQTGLKKCLISPLIISPLHKCTKHPKKHGSSECCCCPQYSHTRLGAYFSLQPKGKSNKLIKKINYCNGSHRCQWQRKILQNEVACLLLGILSLFNCLYIYFKISILIK